MISFDDMYFAYEKCKKKKSNKKSTIKFERHALYNIQNLTDEINSRRYKVRPSECFIINFPTKREVFCANFRDRVVQHFVYLELHQVIDSLLIYDSASCREGKGTDFAINRVCKFLRRCSENYRRKDVYYLKMDFRGFFMCIDRNITCQILIDVVDNYYYGKYADDLKYLIPIIVLNDATKNVKRKTPIEMWEGLPSHKTLFNKQTGLPIGNVCSQMAANLYLNNFDHFLKSRHKNVSRYVDDVIIIDRSKSKLLETLNMSRELIRPLGLRINDKKTFVRSCLYGIEYLGVKINFYYKILSKKRINRVYFKSQQISKTNFFCSCASRSGMFRRYHGYNIGKRWFNSLPNFVKDQCFYADKCKIKLKNPIRATTLIPLVDERDYRDLEEVREDISFQS